MMMMVLCRKMKNLIQCMERMILVGYAYNDWNRELRICNVNIDVVTKLVCA